MMVLRRMLLGGAAAITLGSALACPSLAQAATHSGPIHQPDSWRAPSLTIHKSHQDPADDAVVYTLWVKNDGNADTRGTYAVTDTLPDGLTATSAEGRHWDCGSDATHKMVTCKSDENLAPGETSEPITIRTRITDKDSCQLINVAAVIGGDRERWGDRANNRRGGHDHAVHLTKDVLNLPCHRHEHDQDGVHVTVTGNNNGGRGGDSSGATANDNGHISDVSGGSASAGAKAGAGVHNEFHGEHR
ncbi:putative repeat protein (TIGR01451 family) [Catenulispora sp. GP43]|uniref:hypothetical protein n=1 Tax=Catenulispora sp. GP43 TaxID=3156263 RepID=UPI003513A56A